MTYRTSDDKYIYLPRVLANRNEESVNKLRKDFGEFATNEIHGEYDRGYFKALEDYTVMLSVQKKVAVADTDSPTLMIDNAKPVEKVVPVAKVESSKKDADLSPYLVESS